MCCDIVGVVTECQTHLSQLGRYSVLGLSGELDAANSEQVEHDLRTALEAAQPAGIILDLSNLAFCDSSGLSTLIAVYKQARARQLPLVLAGAHDRVAHVMSLTRVDRLLPFSADLPQAVLHLDEITPGDR
jgi:anti-sigma B factor antagonist